MQRQVYEYFFTSKVSKNFFIVRSAWLFTIMMYGKVRKEKEESTTLQMKWRKHFNPIALACAIIDMLCMLMIIMELGILMLLPKPLYTASLDALGWSFNSPYFLSEWCGHGLLKTSNILFPSILYLKSAVEKRIMRCMLLIAVLGALCVAQAGACKYLYSVEGTFVFVWLNLHVSF